MHDFKPGDRVISIHPYHGYAGHKGTVQEPFSLPDASYVMWDAKFEGFDSRLVPFHHDYLKPLAESEFDLSVQAYIQRELR